MINLSSLTNLSDDELKSSLLLIYPSRSYNSKILQEIERRNIRNDPKILRFLLELKSMNIESWSVDRLLLTLYDLDNQASMVKNPTYIKEVSLSKSFNMKEVKSSIRHKKINKHFTNFVSTLEHIIRILNESDYQSKESTLLKYSGFLFKFLDLRDKIIKKDRKVKSNKIYRLKEGRFHFKETWLLALKNKEFLDQLLFLILFNTRDSKDHRINLLNNSLKKRLPEYRSIYEILENLETRLKENIHQNEGLIIPNVNQKEKVKMFTFSANTAVVTKDEKCIEWYNARKNA